MVSSCRRMNGRQPEGPRTDLVVGGRALGGLLVGMLNDHDSSAVNWSPYKISAGVWYV